MASKPIRSAVPGGRASNSWPTPRPTGAVALLILLLAVADALGATFTVNSTADTVDAAPGNGVCATAGATCTLRAAIEESNALAGVDLIAFSIPLTDPGYNAGTGVFTIAVATALPGITSAGTVIDGTTQTANRGDTNPGLLGTGGTVGVGPDGRPGTLDELALPQVAAPEVEIRDGAAVAIGLRVQSNNVTIRGLAMLGFGAVNGEGVIVIAANFTGTLIENNVLGSAANAFSAPAAAGLRGVAGIDSTGGDSGIIRNNLIGFHAVRGIWLNNASTGWTISGNEIRDSGALDTTDGDGVAVNGSSTNSITGNLIVGSSSQGYVLNAAGVSGNVFTYNTVTANGVGTSTAVGQSAGVTYRGTAGATTGVLDRNLIQGNYGAGVQINDGASGIRLTRNSFSGNGSVAPRGPGAPTGQIGIDLDRPGDDANFGTPPFFTINDPGDGDSGGNAVLNYPILQTASLSGGNLTLTGWARPGAILELFIAAADPSGFGEGQTWVGTFTEGVSDADGSSTTYGPGAINGLAQGTDTTNGFSFTVPTPAGVVAGTILTATGTNAGSNDTSEFSGLVTVSGLPVSGTVFEDVNYGGGAGRDRATASGAVRSGARVELFDGAGTYVTFATTDGSGNYSFPGLVAGTYTVRVVNSTVTSSRIGYVAGLLPVQTFRTDASSGTAVAVTDRVGGQNPGVADAGNAGAGSVMNTTTGVFTAGIGGTAQSITSATLAASAVSGVDFGFNFDTIVNTQNSGQGSLRQFEANSDALANAGLAQDGRTADIDNAIFMLADGTARPGLNAGYASMFVSGIATVPLGSALPAFGDPVILDATTQPGFSGTPVIELDGSTAGPSDGVRLSGGGSTLKGLIINRFNASGVSITGSGGNTLRGNRIGTNAAATAPAPNGADGVSINGPGSNVIGGTAVGDGNIVSGNSGNGISLGPGSSSANLVQGNLIGTNASGADLGNALHGLRITDGPNHTIGGTATDAGNVVAYNLLDGISIGGATATRNAVLSNAIYANGVGVGGAIGIDLYDDGVTVNNGTKNPALANEDMDSPVFTSAVLAGTTLTVTGYVGSAPGQPAFAGARVEIFRSDGDASGHGQGQEYFDFLTTDGSGNFSGSVTASGLADGDAIAGTATDPSNNSSEFGANATVYVARQLVKRAFQLDGTPIASGSTLPSGMPVKFLIYFANDEGALTDVTVRDVLDPAFQYETGSMKVDNTLQASLVCPGGVCDEAAILAQVDSAGTAVGEGDAVTPPIDADEVSYDGGTRTLDVGERNNANNAPLNVAADSVWALVVTIRMQ